MEAGKELSGKEKAKRDAAFAAVDKYVKPGMVVGIGSGSTIVYAVQRIKEIAPKGDVICVPTSFQSRQVNTLCDGANPRALPAC